jgi:hypothetical protein
MKGDPLCPKSGFWNEALTINVKRQFGERANLRMGSYLNSLNQANPGARCLD